ncbi:ATP-binding sensor histidine kinase [Oscillatoria sp. FACHB-1406]|uniref:trifunctional serine/threonine-protein kinase/ATP-binding protein/sensor histidine kinase n=1 Tax=Oscillatoria sp. FACHB-1406 TaxID=2692846 RepID=UPI0016895FC6|nr:ATP-binding sensor histidine kinase [Oscillatoria sp. FACHB-1406]MBD2579401.1 AAA family ATPase [Oscillatoria sp. FACHB-1406]
MKQVPMNASASATVALSGYRLLETLYCGSKTVVYRGVRLVDEQSVAVKLLQQDYPTFNDLLQFRNQYTIAKNLNIPGIIRPYSLEAYRNGYALVMEDFGDVSLREYHQTHPLNLTDVLAIALQLTDILHNLHANRVIHKDVKPANILIHPESKQVKLIDFSIASLLPKETQEIQNPNILEGTLAYLSPEQTGRMNRAIDYRADFYSLGVTLYQLSSGHLPFESEDPLELVHCHIAKMPVPLDRANASVPPMVAALVAKLMAKNAEDRYQSALGLKHDLQQCLMQWRETGAIADFQLGQRDVCDRFNIPEKLYGREAEVQILLDAFERVSSPVVCPLSREEHREVELMLVAGFSGIGKTALVNEVHKPITRQKGYFIKGKFDQLNRNIPLSAFVRALRDLMGQLLSESDTQLAQWKAQILEAVGENGQVLTEVIPELERIIGSQPPAPELSGTAAQNRFNLLFQKFIQVFTAAEHPLVIFLDDLQWADLASLQLIELLMKGKGYLLMLGAYRDNEVSPAHPLMLTLEELKKAGALINTITLTPLTPEHTNHLIADTLNCSRERAQPLTQLVDRKTKGNPFFTTQFLKALYEDGYITFARDPAGIRVAARGYWQCDMTQVNALTLLDDVVEFMAQKLQKLPEETQQVLKLAACVGNQFDLATLAIVSEQSQIATATALWKALQEGLIVPTTQIYKFFQAEEIEIADVRDSINPVYRFLHDRVQQAAYSLIPDSQKQGIHLNIGRLLLAQTPATSLDEQIFTIISQFNLGLEGIDTALERDRIARLNLNAARKARLSAAYAASAQYCEIALQLVDRVWQQPEFALELYVEAANSACLVGAFEQVDRYVATILQEVKNPLDRIKAIEVQIQSFIARNQLSEAIQVGRNTLETLGVILPEQPTSEMLPNALKGIRQQLETIADVAELPLMEEPSKLAAIALLSNMASAAYIGAPALYPLIVLKQIELSLSFGLAAETSYAFATYGLILCAFENEIVAGNRSADIAIVLMEKLQATRFKAKIFNLVYPFARIWQGSLQKTLEPLRQGYQAGLDTGDLEFAAYCAYNHCLLAYAAGNDLVQLQTEMQYYGNAIAQLNQTTALNFHQIGQQAVLNWLGETAQPKDLIGSVYNETLRLPQHQAAGDTYSIGKYYIQKLILTYHFGSPQEALEIARAAEGAIGGIIGIAFYAVFYFYHALTLLANRPEPTADSNNAIATDLDRLRHWETHAPMNFTHRCYLIQAEQQQILGNRADAIDLYDRAIAEAKANRYIQEEALANELAAKFYLAWGKEKVASGYMQEAYYNYARWGAKAKITHLEQRYPQLLQPILQKANQPLTVLETLVSLSAPTYSAYSTSGQSSSSINQTLDFATLLQVSQTLARTIELDELLQTLTQTMLENSGADYCALMLARDNQWQVRVIANLEQVTLQSASLEDNPTVPVKMIQYVKKALQSAPLENNPSVPFKLIQYVKNTLTTVAIDDLDTDLPVISDYMRHHQPKSVLCLPILNQGNLRGIVYLENRSTRGVFSRDRLPILNFLCTQAAISLENARLYQQAQNYVQQLEQSQLQIVQSEKMASLGNLVAGVAHEINNPIGFLNGSINNGKDYVKDLLEHLALYHQHYPNAVSEIQDHAEDIDLEFSMEDLPRLLDAMLGATERIKSISTSLRTFSRADNQSKVSANLHEGIDSTLLILKYRLKANDLRPAIQVERNYGELPLVPCFPGQLNQVFMNIIANAIDALEESNLGRSFAEIKTCQNRISIKTKVEGNGVKISIADNGTGLPEYLKSRIFDYLFTTKDVGKGTGLGLAIARQIIEEKHGGKLEVQSQLGQGSEFCIYLPLQPHSITG